MAETPSPSELQEALEAAGAAHHEYEKNALDGVLDEQWAALYAAYVLGRHGGFAAPSALTRWLKEAPAGEEWAASAARHVLEQIGD